MSADQERVETQADRPGEARAYGYYALLIALYQALYGVFLLAFNKKQRRLERMTALDLAMLGLATLRMSKAISEDEIMEVLREPLIEEDGNVKRPKGRGLRWALGKLVLCPNCTGTWIAAFLGYALHLFPRQTRPLLAIMSASGLEQFSDALLSLVYTDRDLLREKKRR